MSMIDKMRCKQGKGKMNLSFDGLKNLFVLGTCQEYGMQSGELSENNEVHPITKYGIAKNNLRIKLENLQKEYSFNLTWARLFMFMEMDNQ